MKTRFLALLLVIFSGIASPLSGDVRLAGIADQVQSILLEQFSGAINREIQQVLENVTESGGGSEVINGSALLDSLETSVRADISLAKFLLQESLQVAKQLYTERFESPCCLCLHNHSNTQCMKECNSTFYQPVTETDGLSIGRLDLQYSELFGRNVSFVESAIHVPGDIYYRDPRVACFADWTSNLTQHFSRQRETLSTNSAITYQYFGGTLGALRFHPGTTWSTLNNCRRCPLPPVDIYRATERPWYSRTVPDSKVVAIVLDLSGSMSGFRLLLAKLTSVALLGTLTPQDYFYVVQSQNGNEAASLRCSTGVTRATQENVLAMSEVIMSYNNSHLMGEVNFGGALKLVMEQFNSSSACHHIVVVFTDHSSNKNELSNALEVLDRDNITRVFTYIVGQSENENALRYMACQYNGGYYRLRYYNDIQEGVMNFRNELRPISSEDQNSSEIFWNQYRDVFGDYVLSGSAPLFVDDEFLGVMGVDIKLEQFEKNFMNENVTLSYYSLMMDGTGNLLFHPQIDKQLINMSSADDILKFDMRQYEHAINSSELEHIYQAMMNGEAGEATVPVWLTIEREARYVPTDVTYFYKPVEGTQFAVAVVIVNDPSQDTYLVNVTESHQAITELFSARGISFDETAFLQIHSSNVLSGIINLRTIRGRVLPLGITLFAESDSSSLNLRTPISNTTSTSQGIIYFTGSVLHQNLSATLSSSNEVLTFLLDGNGYIVVSSGEGLVSGTNIFDLYPSILQDLVTRGVYIDSGDSIRGYELQPCKYLMPVMGECEFTGCNDNAGMSMYKGFLLSFSNWIVSFLSDVVWITGKMSFLSAVAVFQDLVGMVTAQDSNTTVTGMIASMRNRSATDDCPVKLCWTQFVAHQLQMNFNPIQNASVNCRDNEQIFYDAVGIAGTNLLLLSIDGSCFEPSSQDKLFGIPCPCNEMANDTFPTMKTQQCSKTSRPIVDCSNSSLHISSQCGITLNLLLFIFIFLIVNH